MDARGRWRWFVPCFVGLGVAGCGPPERASERSEAPSSADAGPRPARPRVELPSAVQQALGRTPEGFTLLSRQGRGVLAFRVTSDEAVRTWQSLHAARGATGLYPVILREADDWDLPDDGGVTSPSEVPSDPARWFEQRKQWLDQQGENGRWPIPRGPRSAGEPQSAPVLLHDPLSGAPRTDLVVALFPSSEGWEVASFLGFGGWNDCPWAGEHALVWRAWQARHGAELIALTLDSAEFRVSRRPDRSEALALALDQYVYCYDIVDQGVETVDALAATLETSDYWYFWWD